jgi:hypothetical protein
LEQKKKFVSFAERKEFVNHSSQIDLVGLGILPNEFLILCVHDIDGRFAVADRNIVIWACLGCHEALETFACRNSNTAYNGITPLQLYIP